jgi:Spy/CpxP family protein refolding chaperone
MKIYKFWLAIVIILLIVNSVVLVTIWLHKNPTENDHQNMEPKDVLIKTLSLTQKQQDLFTVMRNKHHELTSKLNDENHILRDSLFDNIKKPIIDTLLINSLSKRISDNETLIEKATLYHFRQLRGILTAEQQSKFDKVIQDVLRMMGRPGPMDGQHKGDGPPDRFPPGRDGRRDHHGPPPDGMPPPDQNGPHDGPPPN